MQLNEVAALLEPEPLPLKNRLGETPDGVLPVAVRTGTASLAQRTHVLQRYPGPQAFLGEVIDVLARRIRPSVCRAGIRSP